MKYLFLTAISLLIILSPGSFNQVSVLKEKQLTFLSKSVDFGDVKPDTTLVAKFFFVNTGVEIITIEFVNPDCSCTNYFLSKKTVEPADTAYVELRLNTANKYGEHKIYSTMKADTYVKMYRLTMIVNIME